MKQGNYVILRNAKIDMFRGSMRLAVNQWGKIEPAPEGASFDCKVRRGWGMWFKGKGKVTRCGGGWWGEEP